MVKVCQHARTCSYCGVKIVQTPLQVTFDTHSFMIRSVFLLQLGSRKIALLFLPSGLSSSAIGLIMHPHTSAHAFDWIRKLNICKWRWGCLYKLYDNWLDVWQRRVYMKTTRQNRSGRSGQDPTKNKPTKGFFVV